MKTRLLHAVLRLRERLWVKPLLYCLLAVAASLCARLADFWAADRLFLYVNVDTVETLLTIISSSMLAVATFAVGSMVTSYASASQSATPRAFTLVLADDASQNALSSFIGAFIFSIVSIVALKTGFYESGGVFLLFILTLAIFAWVILTFVRWVDNIARLGRIGATIDKVEKAARKILLARVDRPFLGGVERKPETTLDGAPVFCPQIGYVQMVDIPALQAIAAEADQRIMVESLPGAFLAPGRPLAILSRSEPPDDDLARRIAGAFVIGDDRTFDGDPRFGLIVLSEIAARALSPAVNDPGTAIVIIGRLVRLFACCARQSDPKAPPDTDCDRVIVPALSLDEMFDDAFTAIARDGAATVEVGIRLQKAFLSLSTLDHAQLTVECRRHSALALARARPALGLEEDIARLEQIAARLA